MRAAKTLLAIFLIAGSLISISPTRAVDSWTDRVGQGGLDEIGDQAYGETGAPEKSIESIIASVVKTILSLLGIIFVVLLIVGGFKYMTSGGSEDKIEEAVKQIRNAVIGLVIIAAAYAITYYVTVEVVPQLIEG